MNYKKKILGYDVDLIRVSTTIRDLKKLNNFISRLFVLLTFGALIMVSYMVENGDYHFFPDVLVIGMLFILTTQVWCLSKLVNGSGDLVLMVSIILSVLFMLEFIPIIGHECGGSEALAGIYQVYSRVMVPFILYLVIFYVVRSSAVLILFGDEE